jgi:acyl carrier protein
MQLSPDKHDQDTIATALVARLSRHFSRDAAPDTVDRDMSFFATGGFAIDGHVLDSLDLVEAVGVLEEELKLDLLDQDLEHLDTINRLAEFVATQGDGSVVEDFCGRWGR